MRKPKDASTRQYVGAVTTLNDTLTKLPPAFNADQKLPDHDIMDIMASKAPKNFKELMTDHGFDRRPPLYRRVRRDLQKGRDQGSDPEDQAF
jgi:hypothetical protein